MNQFSRRLSARDRVVAAGRNGSTDTCLWSPMSDLRFLEELREQIPDFDFNSCWRIVRFAVHEQDDFLDAELVVTYRDENLVKFRAEAVSKLTLSFTGNRMELGEAFISVHDEDICVHDELGHTIVMWCSNLQLIGVEPYQTVSGGSR
jgi:hypothetical protein